MLLQMIKVQIIGTRTVLDKTVRALGRAGVVQIEEKQTAAEPLVLDAEAARLKDETTVLVARVDALLALLPKRRTAAKTCDLYEEQSVRPTADIVADVKGGLTQLDAPAQDLARRRDQLEDDLVTLPRYAKTMRQLMPLAADVAPLKNYETVALLVERKHRAVIEMLRTQLPALTNDQFELVSRDIDADTTAAVLVFPREHSSAVTSLLSRESISQVRLPDELAHLPFGQVLETIESRLKTAPQELDKIHHDLDALSARWRAPLQVWSAVLHDQLQELQVRARFGATKYTFVITGWMPRRRLPALRETLGREVGDEIVLEELETTEVEREHAPVVMSNPRPARPFEFLVRMMAIPRYGTIDPTPFVAIFLPIFFGMILGDVGYGVLVLIGAVYLARRSRPGGLRSLCIVIIYCSVWAIAFGFVYGEFFGGLGATLFHMPTFFARGESVIALFVFSLAFGVVQISLGFALGIYQALKLHQRHELIDRVAKVIGLIGVFMLVAVASNYLPKQMTTPGIAVVIVGTVILGYSIGWIGVLLGPIEMLSTVGNILSYLRLAAIGLSSVYLALVANQLAGVLGGGIIGIIVGALFHALNLALGILSPMIQSLRLHYVEFFGKFYEGGGADFVPFKREGIL